MAQASAAYSAPGNISAPLDPRFTFDNFVVGKPNELAYAAARRVAPVLLQRGLRLEEALNEFVSVQEESYEAALQRQAVVALLDLVEALVVVDVLLGDAVASGERARGHRLHPASVGGEGPGQRQAPAPCAGARLLA